jgi:membrane protease YdiL (CAAX protease family)
MTFKTFIKKHAVAVYGILTISASWLVWSRILTILEPGELLSGPSSEAMIYVALGGIVPSLTGVLMTAYLEGFKGLRELWARVTNWKMNPWLFLAACLPLFMTLASYWLQKMLGIGSASPDILNKIPAGLGIGFFAALGEEFGWRGFALPRLRQRYSPLTAGLLVGLLWGGWHIYPDYIGLGNWGWLSAPIIFILGPVLLTIFAVIMAWLHEKSQNSMLLMMLFHLNISSAAFYLARETNTYAEQLMSSVVTPLIGLLVIAVILVTQTRRHKPALRAVAVK